MARCLLAHKEELETAALDSQSIQQACEEVVCDFVVEHKLLAVSFDGLQDLKQGGLHVGLLGQGEP